VAEFVKSVPLVNLTATPIILPAVGEGAPGILRSVNGHVTASAGASAASIYRLCRIPVDAKIKHVFLRSAAQGGTAAADIGVAYSDSLTDGTQPSFAAAAPNNMVQVTLSPVDNKLFGNATSFVAANPASGGGFVEITFANTFTNTTTLDPTNTPLWQFFTFPSVGGQTTTTQFTSNPGGFFDICVKTTQIFVNGGDISLEVQFIGVE
jgi:hypothetical protein